MGMLRLCGQLVQDLRYAVRMMAANPLFTVMATLSLALGIGANTAIYSFMDAILMRALPVRNPESLVVLNWHSTNHPAVAHSLNGSSFEDPKTGYTSGSVRTDARRGHAPRSGGYGQLWARVASVEHRSVDGIAG